MNNPYVSKTWKDRDTEYPTRRELAYIDPETSLPATLQVTVTRDEGTITEVGDPFAASTMNGLESRINTAFAALAPAGFTEVTGTLIAHSYDVMLIDAAITTASTVDVYTDTFGVNPTNITLGTGLMTVRFEPQENDVGVKVRVW